VRLQLPRAVPCHNTLPGHSPDTRHETTDQKGTHLEGGAAAPDPAAYGLSSPLFQPLTAYAARGRIFPSTSAENPASHKPICKRDVAGAAETQEMRATVDDDPLDARRGQVT
jgi:hypothetical protein